MIKHCDKSSKKCPIWILNHAAIYAGSWLGLGYSSVVLIHDHQWSIIKLTFTDISLYLIDNLSVYRVSWVVDGWKYSGWAETALSVDSK